MLIQHFTKDGYMTVYTGVSSTGFPTVYVMHISDSESDDHCMKGRIVSDKGRGKDHPCSHIELDGEFLCHSGIRKDSWHYMPWGQRVTETTGHCQMFYNRSQRRWEGQCLLIDWVPGQTSHFEWRYDKTDDPICSSSFMTVDIVGCNVTIRFTRAQKGYQPHVSTSNLVINPKNPNFTIQLGGEDRFIRPPSDRTWDKLEMWLYKKASSVRGLGPQYLANDCLRDLKTLDINTVTAIQGFLTLSSTIKSTVKSFTELTVKGFASGYLGAKYGIGCSMRDLYDLSEVFCQSLSDGVFGRNPNQVGRAVRITTAGDVKVEEHLRVKGHRPKDSTKGFIYDLHNLDLYPEMSNLYDMVPFSFVVDWFIPVGDLLESYDIERFLTTLELVDVVYSRRLVTNVDINQLNLGEGYILPLTDIKLRWYQRDVITEYNSMIHALTPVHELTQAPPFSNWAVSTALGVQMISGRRRPRV